MSLSFNKNDWQTAQIEAVKVQVRRELDEASAQGGKKERLSYALQQIAVLEEQGEPESRLRMFVLVMSALVHHERHGGLTDPQIAGLVERGHGVLKLAGIRPDTSRLAFMHGELHLVLSQIHRKAGAHWRALWEQQLAVHMSRKSGPPGGDGLAALAHAIRAQRVGHLERALLDFAEAEQHTLAPAQRELARIGRIRTLRLCGNFEDVKALIAETSADPALESDMRIELEWEVACLTATAEGDLGLMVKAVQRGAEHHQAVYLTETFLWIHASGRRHWLERLPRMATVARKRELKARELGFQLKAVLALEQLFDEAAPVDIRLRAVGDVLAERARFLSIDRELLFILAISRSLAAMRFYPLAAATLAEYRGLSRKLRAVPADDALGLAGDLFDRPWFHGKAAS